MGDLVLVLKLSTFQHPADCDLDFELRCNVKTPTDKDHFNPFFFIKLLLNVLYKRKGIFTNMYP